MKLSEVRPGVLRLEGELTMDSVAAAQALLAGAIGSGTTTLDLAGVSQCDSAALALLLALRRQQAGAALRLDNVPATLHGLANLYELTPLLGLTPEA